MKRLTLSDKTRSALITFAIVIGLFIAVQLLGAFGALSSLIKGQLVPICAYIVMAISLNLVVGVLGELSLGHAGFMSVGAFAGVITSLSLRAAIPSGGLRLLLAILVGGFFAAIAGALVGVPVLRLKGDYLAIVTLAFGEIIKSIINNLYVGFDAAGLHFSLLEKRMTLAVGSKMLIDGPMGVTGNQKLSTFTAGFLLILVCLLLVYNLVDSRPGRAIMALRDNTIAAESVGINITQYKLMAFILSAAMAGMAGALFAMNFATLVPTKFDFNMSILVLVFVVLGGLGNMRGSIIATVLLSVLPELLRAYDKYRMLIYAIVLVLIMLATNNAGFKAFLSGIGARVVKLLRKLFRKGDAVHG